MYVKKVFLAKIELQNITIAESIDFKINKINYD